MSRTHRRRAGLVFLARGSLIACASCWLVSGVDRLQKVPCVDCDASAGDDAGPSLPVEDASRDADAANVAEASIDATGGDATARDAEVHDAPAESGDARPPSMITRVQTVEPGWQPQAQITIAIAEGAGHLLVAGVYGINTSATFTVTDTLGNTWQQTTPQENFAADCQSNGNGTIVQIFYAASIAPGMNTVTIQQSSSIALGAFLVEYAGVRSSGPLDAVSGAIATSGSATMNAGVLATTGSSDVVVAVFADSQNGSGLMVPGAGFVGTTDEGFYSLVEDDLPAGTTPGSVSAAATQPNVGAPDCWAAVAAAFVAEVP